MSKGVVDFDSTYFVFDSESLENVQTQMYGYAITEQGIFSGTDVSLSPEHLDGCGTYVFVKREDDSVTIYQDFSGDFGIFVYQDAEYFAISNSFHMLVDYVKDSHPLTLNRDYCNYYLATWVISVADKETAVNQIQREQSHAVLHINMKTKELSRTYINYEFNTISLDSPEGMNTLDAWYEKWLRITKGIMAGTQNTRFDLSGGFDSRFTFLFALNSGIDLKDRYVHSLTDAVHTHSEDYQIATSIANRYGFALNERSKSESSTTPLSEEDIVNLSYYTKMLFHKELSFPTLRQNHRQYIFGGFGGETIRPYWNMPVSDFYLYQREFSNAYGWCVSKNLVSSIDAVVTRSMLQAKEKYKIADDESSDYSFSLFRDCYSRNHFGRIAVESLLCNTMRISPILDPMLQRLRMDTDSCTDRNLLMAIVFTRYNPELLSFPFDGGRCFKEDTLACAQSICEQFPYVASLNLKRKENLYTLPKDGATPKAISSATRVSQSQVRELFASAFKSGELWSGICSAFAPDYYQVARRFANDGKYFPMRHVYSVIAVADLLQDIGNDHSDGQGTRYERLKRWSEDGPSASQIIYENAFDSLDYFKKYISARIDITINDISKDSIEVTDVSDCNANVYQPRWLQNNGTGIVVESRRGDLSFSIKANASGELKLRICTPDVRDETDKRVPNWITCETASINDQVIVNNVPVWHDRPAEHSTPVNPGDQITVRVKWRPLDVANSTVTIQDESNDVQPMQRRQYRNAIIRRISSAPLTAKKMGRSLKRFVSRK